MKMKSSFALLSILAVLASCATNSPSENPVTPEKMTGMQPTSIRIYDAKGQSAKASCVLDDNGKVTNFTAPTNIDLPISQSEKANDLIITCKKDNVERSAILKSLPATSQSAVLRDSSTGGIATPASFKDGNVTGNISSIDQALILGLSTNVIAGDFYIYPRLVELRY